MPKLQHIRSATPDKRPDPTLLVDGQLSINTAAATPGVYTKNDAGALIKVGPTYVGSAAPNSSPSGSAGNSVGEHWMDTSVAPPVLRVWDGSNWIASQGLTGPQGEVGPQGGQGPAGVDGAAGPQGPAGVDGAAGPQGPAGVDGAAGPQGPAGADGAAGGQGPQGEVGPQGAPGVDGAAGGQGPAGADGAAGGQGPQGEVGPQGGQGPAGADGAAGAQGPAGPNAVSADPYNTSKLGADGLIFTPNTSGFFNDYNARNISGSESSVFPIPPGTKGITVSWAQCKFARLNTTFGSIPGSYLGNCSFMGGEIGSRHDSPGSWLIGESFNHMTCMGTVFIQNLYANIWVITGTFTRYEDSYNYFACGQFDAASTPVTELHVIHPGAVAGWVNIKFAG